MLCNIKDIIDFRKSWFLICIAAFIILIGIAVFVLTKGQGEVVDKKGADLSGDNIQNTEFRLVEEFTGNPISPYVTGEMKKKLQSSLASMAEMGPGVGPWRIVYSTGEKIILYNYTHIVACDISENYKGIYSIIELENLKVGSYQGSNIAKVYPSPDAMVCIIGTGPGDRDTQSPYSLYLCNFHDGSVRELEANYYMVNENVTWYRNMFSSALSAWCVSIKGNDTEIIWDTVGRTKLANIPAGTKLETVESKYMEQISFETGYTYLNWWQKDENTVIGAPYRRGAASALELKLTDFEIIEVDLKRKTGKVLFKIDKEYI